MGGRCEQSVPEGPADEGRTYSVNHQQTGVFKVMKVNVQVGNGLKYKT